MIILGGWMIVAGAGCAAGAILFDGGPYAAGLGVLAAAVGLGFLTGRRTTWAGPLEDPGAMRRGLRRRSAAIRRRAPHGGGGEERASEET